MVGVDDDFDLLSQIEGFTFGDDGNRLSRIVDVDEDVSPIIGGDDSSGDSDTPDYFSFVTSSWRQKLTLYSGLKLKVSGHDGFSIELKSIANRICGGEKEKNDASVVLWQFPSLPLYVGTHKITNHIPNKLYAHSLSAGAHGSSGSAASAPTSAVSETLFSSETTQREIVERHRDRNRERQADTDVVRQHEDAQFYNNCAVTEVWSDYTQAGQGTDIESMAMGHQLQWQAALHDLLGQLCGDHSGCPNAAAAEGFYAVSRSDVVARSHRDDSVKGKGTVLPSVHFFREQGADAPSCVLVHAPQWFVYRLQQLQCNSLSPLEVDTSDDLIHRLYQRNYSDERKVCKSFLVARSRADVLLVADALQEAVFQRTRLFVNEAEHTLCLPELLSCRAFTHGSRRPLSVKFLLTGEAALAGAGSAFVAEELSLKGHVLPDMVRAVCEMVDAEVRLVGVAAPGRAREGGGTQTGNDLDAIWRKYSVGLADTQDFVEERQKAARRLQQSGRGGEEVAASIYNLGEKAEADRRPLVKNPMMFVSNKIVWNWARPRKAVTVRVNGNNKRMREEVGSADAVGVLPDRGVVAAGVAGAAQAQVDSRLAVVTIALTPLRHDTHAIDSFHFFAVAGAEESVHHGEPPMSRLSTQVVTELVCSAVKDSAVAGGVAVQWEMKCNPLHCCLVR